MHSAVNWISAFEAAVLELDAKKLPERIQQARGAILDRIEDLHGINADSERQQLRTALDVLGDLRKLSS